MDRRNAPRGFKQSILKVLDEELPLDYYPLWHDGTAWFDEDGILHGPSSQLCMSMMMNAVNRCGDEIWSDVPFIYFEHPIKLRTQTFIGYGDELLWITIDVTDVDVEFELFAGEFRVTTGIVGTLT